MRVAASSSAGGGGGDGGAGAGPAAPQRTDAALRQLVSLGQVLRRQVVRLQLCLRGAHALAAAAVPLPTRR